MSGMELAMRNFIIGFAKQIKRSFVYDNVEFEQLRSLFTAWCIMFDHEADTQQAYNLLLDIKYEIKLKIYEDEFENFMYEFLV